MSHSKNPSSYTHHMELFELALRQPFKYTCESPRAAMRFRMECYAGRKLLLREGINKFNSIQITLEGSDLIFRARPRGTITALDETPLDLPALPDDIEEAIAGLVNKLDFEI